jgi:hypothetical protein
MYTFNTDTNSIPMAQNIKRHVEVMETENFKDDEPLRTAPFCCRFTHPRPPPPDLGDANVKDDDVVNGVEYSRCDGKLIVLLTPGTLCVSCVCVVVDARMRGHRHCRTGFSFSFIPKTKVQIFENVTF